MQVCGQYRFLNWVSTEALAHVNIKVQFLWLFNPVKLLKNTFGIKVAFIILSSDEPCLFLPPFLIFVKAQVGILSYWLSVMCCLVCAQKELFLSPWNWRLAFTTEKRLTKSDKLKI